MNVSNLDSGTLNLTEYYYLGGFLPRYLTTYHYYGGKQKEFQTANFFYTSASLQYEMIRNLFLTGILNYLDAEYPMKWFYSELQPSKLGDRFRRFGFGFKAGYRSPIGPVNVAIAKDIHRKGWQSFFSIGFIF